MLLEGKGVPGPSHLEAALLLQKAAAAGFPHAQHLLAIMHEYGLGVQQDYHQAGKYYHQAAEQQYVESIFHLALMYAYGRGYTQDFARARSLFDTAARSEHGPSMYYIGIFKTYGYGTEVNYEQAVNWFERSASNADKRFALKAAENAEELKKKVIEAVEKNDKLLDKLQEQGEAVH